MPTVPRYNQPQVREQGLSNAKLDGSAPIEAFGGGAAAANSFRSLGGLAENSGKVVQEIKQEADQRAVMDAVNGFQTHENELTSGENGFLKVKGKNALGVTEQYQELAKKKFDEVYESLGNDDQKYLFKQNAEKIMNNLKYKTETHSMNEYGKYQDQSDQDGIETWGNTAGLNYGDESIVQDAINKKNGHILAMAQRHGWDDDMINNKINETNSKIRLGNTMRIMQDRTASSADAYLRNHEKDFTANDLLTAKKSLESGLRQEKSTYLADQIFDKENYTDVGAAYERVQKIGDEELRDATLSKIKVKIALRDNQIKEEHTKLIMDVSDHVEKGGSIEQLPPEIQGKLGPKERDALDTRRLQKLGVIPEKNDLTKYHKFDSMDQLTLGKKTMADLLIEARPALTNDQWNRVKSKWEVAQGAMNGDPKAKEKWAGYQNENETLLRSMREAKIAGIDDSVMGVKEMNEKQKEAYLKFQNELNDRSLLWSSQNNGKKPDGDTLRKISRDLVGEKAMKVYTDGMIWDSEKQLGELKDSEKESAYIPFNKIPPASIKRMVNIFKSNNMAKGLSDDEVMSLVNNNSGLGKLFRERMQRAYVHGATGNNLMMRKKLLGQ